MAQHEPQKSLSVVNDAIDVGCYPGGGGAPVAGFQLADGGSWVGVVTFEGRIGDGAWTAVEAVDAGNSATKATTRNAVGLFRVDCSGLTQVRCRLSTATGGTLIVRALPPGQ